MNIKRYFSLPISFFGAVMGLSAISLAWFLAYKIIYFAHLNDTLVKISQIFYTFFALLALLVFVFLFFIFIFKSIMNFENIKSEFHNPITKVFFGTFCISCLLLPMILSILLQTFHYESNIIKTFGLILWTFGVILMFGFSLYIINTWLYHKHELIHITPAWIIPVVGLLDIPLALPYIFNTNLYIFKYLTMLCIGTGLLFALILIPLILARIIFFQKLPDKLAPTLLILIAPFSVGFSTYTTIFNIDDFAIILFLIGGFLFLSLLPQIFKAYKCCPFKITWWAISFPLATLNISYLKIIANSLKNINTINFNSLYGIFIILAFGFLIFTTLVFLWLILRTVKGIFSKEIENLS